MNGLYLRAPVFKFLSAIAVTGCGLSAFVVHELVCFLRLEWNIFMVETLYSSLNYYSTKYVAGSL